MLRPVPELESSPQEKVSSQDLDCDFESFRKELDAIRVADSTPKSPEPVAGDFSSLVENLETIDVGPQVSPSIDCTL